MNGRTIIMVTDDRGMADRVHRSLQTQVPLQLQQCRDLAELARMLEQHPCAAALVDLDPTPAAQLTALEPLVERFDQIRFFVVASQVDQDLVLRAMKCGARQFLLKNTLDRELSQLTRKLAASASPGQTRGNALTVLSAGGGCGATTLAINLADELQAISQSPSLLIDLDLAYGAVASYLGLESPYGLADVLRPSREIDPQLIHSTAAHHSDRLHVLVSPATGGTTFEPLSIDRLSRTVHCCMDAYRWTVLDAPRLPLDLATTLALASRSVLIVYQLTVKDIRVARSTRRALIAAGVAAANIHCVVNRYHKRRAVVCLQDADEALGVQSICITNDYRPASQSLNFSQLLSACSPRSALRRDVQRLAATLAKTSQPAIASGSI